MLRGSKAQDSISYSSGVREAVDRRPESSESRAQHLGLTCPPGTYHSTRKCLRLGDTAGHYGHRYKLRHTSIFCLSLDFTNVKSPAPQSTHLVKQLRLCSSAFQPHPLLNSLGTQLFFRRYAILTELQNQAAAGRSWPQECPHGYPRFLILRRTSQATGIQ